MMNKIRKRLNEEYLISAIYSMILIIYVNIIFLSPIPLRDIAILTIIFSIATIFYIKIIDINPTGIYKVTLTNVKTDEIEDCIDIELTAEPYGLTIIYQISDTRYVMQKLRLSTYDSLDSKIEFLLKLDSTCDKYDNKAISMKFDKEEAAYKGLIYDKDLNEMQYIYALKLS